MLVASRFPEGAWPELASSRGNASHECISYTCNKRPGLPPGRLLLGQGLAFAGTMGIIVWLIVIVQSFKNSFALIASVFH